MSENKPTRLVYVVFHGLISLVQNTTTHRFRAYIVSMGDEHRYCYGDWLREIDIPAEFTGEFFVGDGPNCRGGALSAADRPTIKVKSVDETHEAIHARIEFPCPDRIIYANSGSLSLSTGHDCLVDRNVALNAGTTIFRYEVCDFEGCFLVRGNRSIKWEPDSRTTVDVGGTQYEIAALHIFSNPLRDYGPNHSVVEFNLSAQVLGERTVRISRQGRDGRPSTPPDGLCCAELLSLSHREYFLESLANRERGATDATYRATNGGGCESCCSGADGSEG